MKTFQINLGQDINVVCGQIKRGQIARFNESLYSGDYHNFEFELLNGDTKKLIEVANDRSSNKGNWYAHCNGYMFDCIVRKSGYDGKLYIQINTWSGYRREKKN